MHEIRDIFALEAMKVFMTHQSDKTSSIWNTIKIKLRLNGWKQDINYNFTDIAEKSYEMADAMIKAKQILD